MKIAVFYHCAKMGNYIEVDQHIKSHLKGSGLLDRADVYSYNIFTDVSRYEFPTLELLREFSINNPEYYVLYIHSKGVSRGKDTFKPAIDDWREYLLYFMVDNWRECVSALEKGYDTVGINYLQTPLPHFQGNFWWAKASYIKTLCKPKDTKLIIDDQHKKLGFTERHKAEMWLLTGSAKNHSLHSYTINPYKTQNPKENYRRV